MVRHRFTGLTSAEYEHPYDRQARESLQGTAGFEFIMRKVWEFGFEQFRTMSLTGSYLRVTPGSFPDLYKRFLNACKILDVPKVPLLYLEPMGRLNAYATGVEQPIVSLSSTCIDVLSGPELDFIIGHELGHVKSEHVLYQGMGAFLPQLGNQIGQATFGVGGAVVFGVNSALIHWSKMAEFTADRAGMLVCQNYEAAVTTMIKLAGLPTSYFDKRSNIESFLKQAEEFKALDYNFMNKITKFLVSSNTHPWTVNRASELNRWTAAGGLRHLKELYKAKPSIEILRSVMKCPEHMKSVSPTAKFTTCCGKPIVFVDDIMDTSFKL